MTEAVTLDAFSKLLDEKFVDHLAGQQAIAAGVSGGPDSLALLKLLSDWSGAHNGPDIHALSVDHGLRAEARRECEDTQAMIQNWPKVQSHILKWEAPSESRIQEQARAARYDLMATHCKAHNIQYLFLGHHQDDQAETVLFRLAKGSGLDGLGGMSAVQEMKGVTLLRPFLGIPKQRLIETCQAAELSYVEDPANESDRFARVRLRQSMAVLTEEGLTPKRLSKTAARLTRASDALAHFTEQSMEQAVVSREEGRIILNGEMFCALPSEIVVRGVLWCFDQLMMHEDNAYGPRMEKVEDLAVDLIRPDAFRKRTLGGLLFSRKDKQNEIIVELEK